MHENHLDQYLNNCRCSKRRKPAEHQEPARPVVEDFSMNRIRLPLPHELLHHERSDTADKATMLFLFNSGLATFLDADLLQVNKASLTEQQTAILNKANVLSESAMIKELTESFKRLYTLVTDSFTVTDKKKDQLPNHFHKLLGRMNDLIS